MEKPISEHHLQVTTEECGQRLDKFLTEKLPEFSRTRIKALVEGNNLSKSGKIFSDISYKVKPGDEFSLVIPAAKPSEILANPIPLNIVYEDKYLLVINKQAGLTVHPGAGNHGDTMVNALLAHCAGKLSGIGGVERPGIVHRLDKDTSGLMVVAKDDKTHHGLASQIELRELKRIYLAVIWGILSPPNGKIEANIGRSKTNRKKMAVFRTSGKKALTHYKTIETYGGRFSLVECRLETGRTHQIRVHMAHKGNSLVGDKSYGNNRRNISAEIIDLIHGFPRQALHSTKIAFTHPKTGKSMEFMAELPADMQELIRRLK